MKDIRAWKNLVKWQIDDEQFMLYFLVRGYLPTDTESKSIVADINADQDALRELTIKKQNLMTELKNYGENDRVGANFILHD